MSEPPLDDHELRVVRGMIDEYTRERARKLVLREFFEDGRTVAIIVSASVLFALNAVTLYVLLRSIH